MIAFSRKNLSCLIWKANSFVCESPVSLSPFRRLLSISSERELVQSPTVYDVLVHKFQFSAEVATIVASDLSRFRIAKISYSTLSFLKESGFSSAQLQKIVKIKPRILTARVEDDIRFKIKILQDLGLSLEDIANVFSSRVRILDYSAKNRIIPSLSLLRDLLGSNRDVATQLTRYPSFLAENLEKTLVPNVAFLKSCGIHMENIRILLYASPRCIFFNPYKFRKSVDKAIELGCSQSSRMFVYAVRVIASTSKETWELKWQAFRDLGFADSDISTIFTRAPSVFTSSTEKVRKVKELVLATRKFTLASIVNFPMSLGYSVEKRLKPRLQILGTLESKNLLKKWPSLGYICSMSDDKFDGMLQKIRAKGKKGAKL